MRTFGGDHRVAGLRGLFSMSSFTGGRPSSRPARPPTIGAGLADDLAAADDRDPVATARTSRSLWVMKTIEVPAPSAAA
jgi:hypothetical protein